MSRTGTFEQGIARGGPDFTSVDSKLKAEDLYRRGVLVKLLLLPTELGGQEVPANVVFVPAFAANVKARIDHNVVQALVGAGKVTRYRAIPEYQGDSFIPCAITITASNPGKFSSTIDI